jgi:hypothetical protein
MHFSDSVFFLHNGVSQRQGRERSSDERAEKSGEDGVPRVFWGLIRHPQKRAAHRPLRELDSDFLFSVLRGSLREKWLGFPVGRRMPSTQKRGPISPIVLQWPVWAAGFCTAARRGIVGAVWRAYIGFCSMWTCPAARMSCSAPFG